MILNKIYGNIKNIMLWEYMAFSQDDRNLLLYNKYYPLNSRIWKKMSQELPWGHLPKSQVFFYFYIISIIEII